MTTNFYISLNCNRVIYDSVAVKADIEIGGHDQLWNLMLGREIQKFYSMTPQVAMTFPLLVGTDGTKKMSQSFDNYISITDTPENIYGKVMSIPDEVMWEYFTMLTDLDLLEIAEFKKSIQEKGENPFNTKKLLGKLIVSELYSDNEARSAETSFQNITINKNKPDDLQIFTIDKTDQVHLPKILTENGITKSNSEARRLIESGSFKINDEKYTELDVNIDKILNKTIQLGKRTFFTLN